MHAYNVQELTRTESVKDGNTTPAPSSWTAHAAKSKLKSTKDENNGNVKKNHTKLKGKRNPNHKIKFLTEPARRSVERGRAVEITDGARWAEGPGVSGRGCGYQWHV